MAYFVIANCDGETTVNQMSERTLLQRINPEENGGGEYYGNSGFLEKIPENSDTNYWGDNILIIKGDIISPKPVKVVKKYTL